MKIKPLGLDLETTGLDPHVDTILLYGHRKADKNYIHDYPTEQQIFMYKDELEDPDVPVIIHNSAFDCYFLKVKYGINVRGIRDTQVMQTLIIGKGELAGHRVALDVVLKEYRIYSKMDKSTRDTFIGHTGPITPKQIRYFRDDLKYLEPLWERQQKMLKRLGLETVAQLENLVCEIVYQMRAQGIHVDVEKWQRLADESETAYTLAETELNKLIGGNRRASYHVGVQQDIFETREAPNVSELKVNWESNVQVKKFFKQYGGIDVKSYKELPGLAGHPLVDAFLNMQKRYKNVTTYGHSFIEQYARNGIVHPSFNQIVSTGRFSCREPNMQNLPKESLSMHRHCFVPSPGYKFAIADFEGQELGLMAHASDDPAWLEPILRGDDLHSVMASMLFPEWEKVGLKSCAFPRRCQCPGHKALRQKAKTFNFGIPYGKRGQSISQDLGISVNDAYRLVRRMRGIAPRLMHWLDDNGREAITTRKIRTLPPFNRLRVLEDMGPELDWHVRNVGFNTPVQGSGADMIKLSMWYAYKSALENPDIGGRLLVCVHDELITEAPANTIKQWAALLKDAMRRAAEVITRPGLINVEPIIVDKWQKEADK